MSLAREIIKRLNGDWHGSYGTMPGPGHSKSDRSLKVSDHKRDAGNVILHSFAGDDVLAIKAEWRDAGLLPKRGCAATRPSAVKITAPPPDNEGARSAVPALLMGKSRPAPDTPVERYLRSRNIDRCPESIRYLPASDRYPWPAMIVAAGVPDEPEPGVYTLPPERLTGVHLTYLARDGSGKAPVNPSRRMLGRIKGSPLALMPPNDGNAIVIAEGIESALAAHIATGLGAWAAASAGFLPALADEVPDFVECVAVFVEDDPAGTRGAEKLLRRISARGVEAIEWRAL
jgi:hypothetical protein